MIRESLSTFLQHVFDWTRRLIAGKMSRSLTGQIGAQRCPDIIDLTQKKKKKTSLAAPKQRNRCRLRPADHTEAFTGHFSQLIHAQISTGGVLMMGTFVFNGSKETGTQLLSQNTHKGRWKPALRRIKKIIPAIIWGVKVAPPSAHLPRCPLPSTSFTFQYFFLLCRKLLNVLLLLFT